MGRAGATVGYKSFDFGGSLDANSASYGAFGEYFIGQFVSIGGAMAAAGAATCSASAMMAAMSAGS